MLLFDERQRRRVDTHSMNANQPTKSTKIIIISSTKIIIISARLFRVFPSARQLASWCAGSALKRPRESVPATPAPAVHDPDAKRRVRYCVAPLPAQHGQGQYALKRPTHCWVLTTCRLTPPGRQSTCYEMLHNPVVSKIQSAVFSAQGNRNSEVTSKSRRPLGDCDFRRKCIIQKELRRYVPRSILPSKSAFSAPFRGVLPPPGSKSEPMRQGRSTL